MDARFALAHPCAATLKPSFPALQESSVTKLEPRRDSNLAKSPLSAYKANVARQDSYEPPSAPPLPTGSSTLGAPALPE